ncbi:TonB-dependent receptor [[Flexibacter] sp. ATCC 35208]|uniref:TonB-dependent receptor n=1 Tax=[Flexibacter] sp. ATCC 35208 TaxID=1936242 RepID=UPI0009C4713C|nr:TonB-dependent receptor [[Flexibacter] sp. ATCC 35208]OMP76827.1 TonB-dependent receptor [[Flexibacter] sp. ATCC 35208]
MKAGIHLLRTLFFFTASLICLVSDVTAQQSPGNIKGLITDTEGNALPGASVKIKGTTKGVSTGTAGTFELQGVKEGSYTLQINYMGYAPMETEVKVKGGSTVVKDIKMSSNVHSLSTIQVSSVMEGQQKALNQQRNADNIKQVVSADVMGRFPDLNVAESMQRLPGVTIGRNTSGEGATVQLRGTPGNFTNINVNGEQIMGSSEDGERNATLDLIPVNVLSSMEVIKTLTPDLDGDAIAGVVNMKSPTAISLKPRLALDAGLGYNQLRSKSNGIGNISYGQRFFQNENNPNGKLGVILTGSYYRTTNGYDEVNAQVWELKDFGDGKDSIYFPTDIRYLYTENQRTRVGASATIDYNFSPVTNLVLNVMYSDRDNNMTRYRKRTRMQTKNTSVDADGNYVTSKGRSYNEIKDASEDNGNLNFNLQGETQIGRVKLDGGAFYSISKLKSRNNTFNFITGNIPLTISKLNEDYLMATGTDWRNDASLFTYNTIERDYFNIEGKNFVAKINATVPYKIGNNSAIFKAGVKVKSMHNKRYKLPNTLVANFSGDAADGKLTNFAGLTNVDDELLDGNFDFGLGVDKTSTINYFNKHYAANDGTFTTDESSTRVSKDAYFYDAVETITAGYLMNRIQFNRFMLLGGLRVERTDVDYKGNIITQDEDEQWASTTLAKKTNSYVRFLPNIQGKYDLTKSSLIRGGVTFGYSRPNFADLVPGRIINILSETVTDGNPELKPAFSTNVDLMAEKYLSNLGILSGGIFYKKIDKFQYNSVINLDGDEFDGADQYTGWRYYQTLNGNSANVYGLELNAQANMTFLPGFLKGFTIFANYTYSHSDADAQFRKNLRLPGQATHSANGSLAYSLKGFTIQGNLNYNGSYVVSLGDDADKDVIRDARVQVDANASYQLSKYFTVYVEAQNLTNAPQRSYFGNKQRIYEKQFYSYWGRAGLKFRF